MITVRTEKEVFTLKLSEKESQEAFWKVVDSTQEKQNHSANRRLKI